MKSPKEKTIYPLHKLIDGAVIGQEGFFAAVPEEGYKGHPFKIQHYYQIEPGKYGLLEVDVKDWNKAVAFRKHPQTIPGRSGWYTLGYFKMPEKI